MFIFYSSASFIAYCLYVSRETFFVYKCLFISFNSNVPELESYLREHKDFHPDQRELFHTLLQLEGPEVKELVILSGNIATKGYDLDEIIPLA